MNEKNYKTSYFIALVSIVFMLGATIYFKISNRSVSYTEIYQAYSLVFLFCAISFLKPEPNEMHRAFWRRLYFKFLDQKFVLLNALIIIFSTLLLSVFKANYPLIILFTLLQVFVFYTVLSSLSISIRKWLFYLNIYLFFFSFFVPQVSLYNPFGSLFLHLFV